MTIVFTGGGTGGHIYPNLAIIENLNEYNDKQILYIGNNNSLEQELCNRKAIKFIAQTAPKLSGLKNNPIRFVTDFIKAVIISINTIKNYHVRCIFGTGGYVAAPTYLAALITWTPLVIHNLDAHLGIVNRIFALYARFVCFGFKVTLIDDKKYFFTGNPISQNFIGLANEQAIDKVRLLVTGGSQGALYINDLIGNLFKRLSESAELQSVIPSQALEINLVTGKKLYSRFLEENQQYLDELQAKNYQINVLDYSHNMFELMDNSNVCIARAGAMTCSELAQISLCPIFIPLPSAAHDHQNKNAQSFVNQNACFLINQQESVTENQLKLIDILQSLIAKPQLIKDMQKNIKILAKPNASEDLIEIIQKTLKD